MRIAVTALGPGIEADVDPRFGRARYFVMVDTQGGSVTSVDNTVNLDAAQGAGIQAGRKIVELGAEVVLTGHVGPKAFDTLQAGDVRIFTGAAGKVVEAINAFQAGQLSAAEASDVQGHWS